MRLLSSCWEGAINLGFRLDLENMKVYTGTEVNGVQI